MNFSHKNLAMILLLCTVTAHAGVNIGGTRLIFDGAKEMSSITVSNADETPYLIQSWVEPKIEGGEKAPFIITPPLFNIPGGQQYTLRVIKTKNTLASDRETLYWMDIKAIPTAENKEGKNTFQLAVKTRMKLIYRPEGLKGVPEDVAKNITWKIQGDQLKVFNPTPFYINFHEVSLSGKDIPSATYVAPMSHASFELPPGIAGNNIRWNIINDYGGVSGFNSAIL